MQDPKQVTIEERVHTEIDKFKDFAKALQVEGWGIDAILNILKTYLTSKIESK